MPFDQLPNMFNPPEGFVVTANQAVTGPDYRWYLSDSPDQGYRSQRIRNLLTRRIEDGSRLDVSDMTRLQLDDRNPMAPVLVPYLMRQLMTSEYYADGQRLLLDWDFTQPADSAAAAYFNVVWSNVLRLTFHDQLPEQLWPDGGQRWMAVVSNLLRQPDNQWWDDADTEGVVEDRDMILAEAMRDARDELTRKVALSPKRWAWGQLHHLDLENQSLGQSGIGVVEAIFNRGPFDVGGGSSSVDATSWDASEGYDVTASPSMRMVVDLDDLDRSRWVNLTGASGHVASEALPRPDAAVGRRPDPRLGVQPRRGAQGERGRARARADQLGPGSSPINRGGVRPPRWPPRSPAGRGRRAARCPGPPRS